MKSYLCATATPFGVFANSTEPDDWDFFQNLGRNQFKNITSDLFWRNTQNTPEEENVQSLADAETYYEQGNTKYNLKQYAAAIADYDNAIRLKPDHVKAYYNRGLAKERSGQYAAAIADYDKVIQLKPDDAYAYYLRKTREFMELVINEQTNGQYNLATIADYDNAIRLKLDDADVYYRRAEAMESVGRYANAIADYDNAIRLKPDHVMVYHARGKAKIKLKQYAAAIVDYDRAIQLEQDDLLLYKYYRDRGEAKEFMGKSFGAMVDFHRARRILKKLTSTTTKQTT